MKNVLLFLISFAIIFSGMTLTNIISCVIYGISEGNVMAKILGLPYILYVIFSAVLSALFLCLVFKKKKK